MSTPGDPAGRDRGDVVCLSATEPGRAVAARLPYRHVHGDPGAALRREWGSAGGFVVVLAAGATVRLVAPLLSTKAADPAVVCVDDAGRYAVSLVGGHVAGANALAEEVAGFLGAHAVVTTAAERTGGIALDMLPGLRAEGDLARVGGALLAGGPVALSNELGWPLPDALLERCAADSGAGAEVGAGTRIVVTDRVVESERPDPEAGDTSPVVYLRPPSLVAGVGSSSDATAADVVSALSCVLEAAGLSAAALGALATVDRRAEHPAFRSAAAALGVPVVTYPPAVLDAVIVPSPSDTVRRAVGTGSVAEAAALAASRPGGILVSSKRRFEKVTVALARRGGPRGLVSVVGLGPGSELHRTPAATRAVRHADVVIGLSNYVEQCADLVSAGQRVLRFPLGTEVERARAAVGEAEKGLRVALVCSGDAGVYAMASPLLELGEAGGVDVEVVPGVTAGLASGAVLGAPLGHDHAVVSLSDLHTPWERIAARLEAAAASDFVVVLYNPRSARRTWQLDAAREILLQHRSPRTPVGVVTDAARPGERVVRTTLGDLEAGDVSMTSCVVVGSSSTRMVGGRMVTPRGFS